MSYYKKLFRKPIPQNKVKYATGLWAEILKWILLVAIQAKWRLVE